MHRRRELQPFIRQQVERQVQALHRLPLVLRALRAQSVYRTYSELPQVGVMIAKGARLRRAAARSGDGIPSGREFLIRSAGARVAVNDRAAWKPGNVDDTAPRRAERNR